MMQLRFVTAVVFMLGPLPALAESRLDGLTLLKEEYPRAFYFRQTEGRAAQTKLSYEEWESAFAHLDGIEFDVLHFNPAGGRRGRAACLRVSSYRLCLAFAQD